MKTILKIFGAVILGFVVLFSMVGLVAPHHVVIEESIIINAPAEKIFEQINLWSNFKNWSPWNELDPDMKTLIEGKDGSIGAVYRWESNKKAGSGYLKKTKIIANSEIAYELHLVEPWQSNNTGFIKILPQENDNKVIWGFSTYAPFPRNVILYFMKSNIARDYKKGLNNLKKITETSS